MEQLNPYIERGKQINKILEPYIEDEIERKLIEAEIVAILAEEIGMVILKQGAWEKKS